MSQVHYELLVRRKVGAQWTLEIATENRAHALQVAEDVLTQNRAVASRVTKETLADLLSVDPELWKAECKGIHEFYAKFGDKLPQRLADELSALSCSGSSIRNASRY